MLDKNVIVYEGNKFYTYTALVRHYGLSMSTFNKRKREQPDLGLEYWVTGVVKPEQINEINKNYTLEYAGNKYKNYTVLCKTLGINYKTFLNRRKTYPDLGVDYWVTGNKPEGFKKHEDKTRKGGFNKKYNGIFYRTIDDICIAYAVPKKTFEKRRYKYPNAPIDYWLFGTDSGYDPLAVLKEQLNLNYKGKKYKNIDDICEAFNVSKNFFNARFDNNPDGGLEFFLNIDNKAINRKEVKYKDVWYKSYKDLIDEVGAELTGFYRRRQLNPNATLEYWLYGKN